MSAVEIQVVAALSHTELEAAYAIRRRVFIVEQHVPEEIELDADDGRAFHALAIRGGQAAGCGRYVEHGPGEIKIGRMAVLRELRRSGIGRAILEFLMRTAREHGYRRAILHAQLTAEGFYLRQGFTPVGEIFDEAGIPHRAMRREL
ncbi:MAG TPA: GNAT family N-acetyltransferase [Candidatus Binataceae bacterium]|nr:GNAT family N-acetyltransferase [Candidatus Binataceae bacterium]